jgi:hypothetical protein
VIRTTVTADENSDVESVVGELRQRCQRNGLPLPLIELVAMQVLEILTPLVARGKTLSAQGSQLRVTRDIEVDGCSVRVAFGSGVPQSAWRKAMNRLFGS